LRFLSLSRIGISKSPHPTRRVAMAAKTMHPSITDRMMRARYIFEARAKARDGDPELYEALEDLATCQEELKASMDLLKVRIEEVQNAIGHHLESTGTVPHTRRRC
jgi:hypothetical protein